MPKQSHLASVKTPEPEDEPAALREPVTQPDLAQMEAVVLEAARQEAPMVSRLSRHRDQADLAIKELDSEEHREPNLDPAVVERMGLKRAKRLGEVGARGGGQNSTPRIHTPAPFRSLLIDMARSVRMEGL